MRGIHSFDDLLRQLQLRKIPFFITFFVVVFVSYAVLYAIDFIPEPIEEETQKEVVSEEIDPVEDKEMAAEEEVAVEEAEIEPSEDIAPVTASALPTSIYFDKFKKEVKVLNPASPDIAALDEALLSGAIRHPESATLTEDGNVFIMAHSSYLPNVLNKNFQAFNDIQKMSWGDMIRVRTEDMEYVYRVQKVYQDKASAIFIPDTPGEARLTLATCNVLGAKEDRYIVEAVLIGEQER